MPSSIQSSAHIAMEDSEQMREYGLDRYSAFSYVCHGCGLCCRQYRIQLNPCEELRLARHLRLSTSDFARDFEEGGPFLRRIDGACVFLRDNRCTVHEARPLGCRLYPLVRRVDADNVESFSCLNPIPGSPGEYGRTATLTDYLQGQNAHDDLAAADLYIALQSRMSTALEVPHGDIVAASKLADPARLFDLEYMVTTHCRRKNLTPPVSPLALVALHVQAVDTWLSVYLTGREPGTP